MAFFLALEGADNTGKSTAHRKVVDELIHATDRPVAPSKEPGSVDFDPSEGWSLRKKKVDVESHLNTATHMLGLAASMCENELASSACLAAAFVARHGTYVPPLHEALRPGGKSIEDATTWYEELTAITEEWENFLGVFEMSPVLKQRFAHYTARDAIRHAILYASDSGSLPPTATGLMFFADHVLHGEMVDGLPENAIVVSDRTHVSQRAYSRVRGDDRRVIELYDKHAPVDVDQVAVLTASEGELASRAAGAETSTETDWDTASQAVEVQKAYRRVADGLEAGVEFIDTEANTVVQTTKRVLDLIPNT